MTVVIGGLIDAIAVGQLAEVLCVEQSLQCRWMAMVAAYSVLRVQLCLLPVRLQEWLEYHPAVFPGHLLPVARQSP